MSNRRSATARPDARGAAGHKPASGQRPGGLGPRGGPAVMAAVGVVVLAVIAGVAFLATRGGNQVGGAESVQVAHVHGLGVDPSDGALYAGTHYGLFRLAEGSPPRRVTNRVQDYMGFTVAGPGHYLASGHPGEGQGGPASVGLIESTDAGRTWQALSLAGEADFHSLEARHGLVYGLNSMTGELLVTQDKRRWETRSRIAMADFAVSPDDPDVLLATTERGLARSDDGGRTFSVLPGALLVQLVSWAEDGTIVGAAPDGAVLVSPDDGATWQRRGSLGAAPHALAAQSDRDIAAAIDGAILVSSDGGRSFDARHRE